MKQPRCPRCQGLLVLEPAVAGLPERVLCRACGWQKYRETQVTMAEIPAVPEPRPESKQRIRTRGTCFTCGRPDLVLVSIGGDCHTCYRRYKYGPSAPEPADTDYISNGTQSDVGPSHENTIQSDATAPETATDVVAQLTPPLDETPPHEADSGPCEPISDLAQELAGRILSRVHELMKPKSKRRQLWEQRNRIHATTSCTCALTTTP